MTEAEARTKWCPMARVRTGITNSVAAANRNLLDRDETLNKCLGTGCAVWVRVARDKTDGYCGLVSS